MQLPEELERIVRDYSKPLLRYPQEYKLALVEMDLVHCGWSSLKRKLSSPDADQVVKALRDYLEAIDQHETCATIYRDNAIKPLDDYLDAKAQGNDIRLVYQHSRDERSKMMSNWMNSIDAKVQSLHELMLLIR